MSSIKIYQKDGLYIDFFCEELIQIGDFVYGKHGDPGTKLCRSFKNRRVTDKLLGVSLVDVVAFNPEKPHYLNYNEQAMSGSKIIILYNGEIRTHLKYRKIPYGQPLYLSKKGKITWRKHGPQIGRAITNQDEDGFLKVRIEINERD